MSDEEGAEAVAQTSEKIRAQIKRLRQFLRGCESTCDAHRQSTGRSFASSTLATTQADVMSVPLKLEEEIKAALTHWRQSKSEAAEQKLNQLIQTRNVFWDTYVQSIVNLNLQAQAVLEDIRGRQHEAVPTVPELFARANKLQAFGAVDGVWTLYSSPTEEDI